MTENEAIEILDEIQTVNDGLNQYIRGYDEAFDTAKEAVEKQIRKKPILDNGETCICPMCHSADITTQNEYGENNGHLNYCGNCGQKLNWEEIEW